MTNKQRVKQLEKNAPKPEDAPKVNPYLGLSKAELFALLREIVNNGEVIEPEYRAQVERHLNIVLEDGRYYGKQAENTTA